MSKNQQKFENSKYFFDKIKNSILFRLIIQTSKSIIHTLQLSIYLFVSNKRKNGWTNRVLIFFCDISHDHREGLRPVEVKYFVRTGNKDAQCTLRTHIVYVLTRSILSKSHHKMWHKRFNIIHTIYTIHSIFENYNII